MFKSFAQWKVMFGSLVLWTLLSACGTKQPGVTEESKKNPVQNLSHQSLTSNCSRCHESDRKAAAVDLVTIEHGLGADCESCHTWPSFLKAGLKPQTKAHNPPPKVCMGCHDRGTEKTVHVARGECAACHQFGAAWVPK